MLDRISPNPNDADLLQTRPYVVFPCMGGTIAMEIGFDLETGHVRASCRSESPILVRGCRHDFKAVVLPSRSSHYPFPLDDELKLQKESILMTPAANGTDFFGIGTTALSGEVEDMQAGLERSIRMSLTGREEALFLGACASLAEMLAEATAARILKAEEIVLDATTDDEASLQAATELSEFISLVEKHDFTRKLALPHLDGYALVDRASACMLGFTTPDGPDGSLTGVVFPRLGRLTSAVASLQGTVPIGPAALLEVLRKGHMIPVLIKDDEDLETPHIEDNGDVEWVELDINEVIPGTSI